jgi:hypothetical protein
MNIHLGFRGSVPLAAPAFTLSKDRDRIVLSVSKSASAVFWRPRDPSENLRRKHDSGGSCEQFLCFWQHGCQLTRLFDARRRSLQ